MHEIRREAANRGGYSMAHAAMMLIPEAWAGNQLMSPERKAFYLSLIHI